MKIRQMKRLGVALQLIFLISLVILFYFEKRNALGLEVGLICFLFAVSMGMLFVSEKEDDQQAKTKVRGRH